MSFVSILNVVIVLCYLISAGSILSKLMHHQGPNPKVFLPIGSIAVFSHIILLTQHLFLEQTIDVSLLNMVSLMALVIALTTTLISFKYKTNLMLPVSYGFAALLVGIIGLVPNANHLLLDTNKAGLFAHVTLALMAYAILAVATLYAFQVNYINFKLKSKNLLALSHLPPLMQVEGQLYKILIIGTICLFSSQMVGLIFIEEFFGKAYVHKTVLSFLALGIYIIMLWGHFKNGWRGQRILSLSLISIFLLSLSYFGSKFVKEFILS